jgi:hypothetical protein
VNRFVNLYVHELARINIVSDVVVDEPSRVKESGVCDTIMAGA